MFIVCMRCTNRYPLKAARVMHTVAMRTEATMPEEEPPANLGRAFKVFTSICLFYYYPGSMLSVEMNTHMAGCN